MNTNNMFNNFFEAQKKLLDSWNETWNETMKENQSTFFSTNKNFDDPFQNFRKNFWTYTGSPTEVWQNVENSSKIYYDMYETYKNFVENNIQPQNDLIQKNLKDFMEKSGSYVEEFYTNLMPDEVFNVFKQGKDLNKAAQTYFSYFSKPLLESVSSLTDAYMAGVYKDPEAFLDFFEEWKKAYLSTFSKVLEMPTMGISRESQEEVLKGTDRFVKMVAYQMELITRIMISTNKNTVEVFEDLIKQAQEGEEIKSFEEFYEEFRKSLDKAFDSLFYSDEFSKLLAAVLDSSMEFKMINDKIMEKQLTAFPVVLKSDINSLYKTVYDLRKEVRDLKKDIEELKEEKKPAAKKTTRTSTSKPATPKKPTTTDKEGE